jgi:hypothetical protein
MLMNSANTVAPCGYRTWQGSRRGAALSAAPHSFARSHGSRLHTSVPCLVRGTKHTFTIGPSANVSICYQPRDQMGRYNRALRVGGDQYHVRPACHVSKSAWSSDGPLPVQLGQPLWVLEQVIIQPEMRESQNVAHVWGSKLTWSLCVQSSLLPLMALG